LAGAAWRRDGRFLGDRVAFRADRFADGFADRLADGRRAARRAGLARFAAFFAFELFGFAIASILSEP